MISRTGSVSVFLLVLILVQAQLAFSDSETQTSWTGGPGVGGPVTSWGTYFSSSAFIDYTSSAGQLLLGQALLGEPVQHTIRTGLSGARWSYGADIDLDGDIDIIGAIYGSDDIIWWENFEDTGDTWIDHLVDGSFDGACCVMAADINDDGDTDMIGAASIADDIAWWRNEGSSWTKITVDSAFDGAHCVWPADIDRDGDLDIVGAGRNADDITWWANIGGFGTSWVENTIDGSFDGASSVTCIDMDSDGNMDVLAAAEFGDRISWWDNVNGDGTSWFERTVITGFGGASSVQAVDMDGDGDQDVLGCANVSDEIAWFRNDNGWGTSWSMIPIDAGLNGMRTAAAADLDGDGDMDVAGGAYGQDDIFWWENENGSGTSWTRRTIHSNFDGPWTVVCVDVDGNGSADVLCTGEQENANAWWQLTGYVASGELVSSILDTQVSPIWGSFVFNSLVFPGAGVRFQVRSSNQYWNMGSWSPYFSESGFDLGSVLDDGTRYFQYKAALSTNDPVGTPLLNDITVSWTTTGIEGGQGDVVPTTGIVGISPNPSSGSAQITFGLEKPGSVSMLLFDMSGRVAATLAEGEFQSGFHTVNTDGLLPGIYLCRMTIPSIGDSFTERLVVIE